MKAVDTYRKLTPILGRIRTTPEVQKHLPGPTRTSGTSRQGMDMKSTHIHPPTAIEAGR